MNKLIIPGLAVLILSLGCGRSRSDADVPPSLAANQVGDMLYKGGLVADSQVNARVAEYMKLHPRTQAGRDSALLELHRWMTEWAASHPDRVAAARKSGAVYQRPPGSDHDTSMYRAQVDSVRRLLAEQRRKHPSQRIVISTSR